MTDKKKLGKQSRDKGGRYERKVRDLFQRVDPTAYRSAQRKGNRNAADLGFDGRGYDLHVECKYVKAVNLRAVYEAAREESGGNFATIVVSGQPRQRDLAVVDLDFLLDLLEDALPSEPSIE